MSDLVKEQTQKALEAATARNVKRQEALKRLAREKAYASARKNMLEQQARATATAHSVASAIHSGINLPISQKSESTHVEGKRKKRKSHKKKVPLPPPPKHLASLSPPPGQLQPSPLASVPSSLPGIIKNDINAESKGDVTVVPKVKPEAAVKFEAEAAVKLEAATAKAEADAAARAKADADARAKAQAAAKLEAEAKVIEEAEAKEMAVEEKIRDKKKVPLPPPPKHLASLSPPPGQLDAAARAKADADARAKAQAAAKLEAEAKVIEEAEAKEMAVEEKIRDKKKVPLPPPPKHLASLSPPPGQLDAAARAKADADARAKAQAAAKLEAEAKVIEEAEAKEMAIEEKIRDLFNDLDIDNSGLLSKKEVGVLSSKLGEGLSSFFSNKKLDIAFREMDPNQDGVVTVDEFIAWHRRNHPIEPKDIYESASQKFDQIDRDKSGYLDKKEVQKLLSITGKKKVKRFSLRASFGNSGLPLDEVFEEMDLDGDGKVSREEFLMWYFHENNLPFPVEIANKEKRKMKKEEEEDEDEVKTGAEAEANVETLTKPDLDKVVIPGMGNSFSMNLDLETANEKKENEVIFERKVQNNATSSSTRNIVNGKLETKNEIGGENLYAPHSPLYPPPDLTEDTSVPLSPPPPSLPPPSSPPLGFAEKSKKGVEAKEKEEEKEGKYDGAVKDLTFSKENERLPMSENVKFLPPQEAHFFPSTKLERSRSSTSSASPERGLISTPLPFSNDKHEQWPMDKNEITTDKRNWKKMQNQLLNMFISHTIKTDSPKLMSRSAFIKILKQLNLIASDDGTFLKGEAITVSRAELIFDSVLLDKGEKYPIQNIDYNDIENALMYSSSYLKKLNSPRRRKYINSFYHVETQSLQRKSKGVSLSHRHINFVDFMNILRKIAVFLYADGKLTHSFNSLKDAEVEREASLLNELLKRHLVFQESFTALKNLARTAYNYNCDTDVALVIQPYARALGDIFQYYISLKEDQVFKHTLRGQNPRKKRNIGIQLKRRYSDRETMSFSQWNYFVREFGLYKLLSHRTLASIFFNTASKKKSDKAKTSLFTNGIPPPPPTPPSSPVWRSSTFGSFKEICTIDPMKRFCFEDFKLALLQIALYVNWNLLPNQLGNKKTSAINSWVCLMLQFYYWLQTERRLEEEKQRNEYDAVWISSVFNGWDAYKNLMEGPAKRFCARCDLDIINMRK
eukprot:g1739.t1